MNRAALLTAAFVSTLILTASPASAQELSKEAKIERILALSHADATINQVFDQVKAMTASQMPAGTTPEQRARAQEIQSKMMDLIKARMSWDKMEPQFAKLYAETFSDQEIDGILAFYESPAGRAMLEKMPLLMTKMMPLIQAQISDLIPEIERIAREAQQK
jgi:hypothetical protein